MMNNKEQLRKKYLKRRKELPPEKAEQLSTKICDRFLLSPNITDHCVFHIYLPIRKNGEVNTLHIIKRLQSLDKTIVVPRMVPGNTEMETCLLVPDDVLIPNKYGIPEPLECPPFPIENIDVVILPLLSYDNQGYRIGYGKGYYDRFIPNLKKSVLKVGLSFFDPEPKTAAPDKWDIPMQYCVTPEKTIIF